MEGARNILSSLKLARVHGRGPHMLGTSTSAYWRNVVLRHACVGACTRGGEGGYTNKDASQTLAGIKKRGHCWALSGI